MRVLMLGGTTEASMLARMLAGDMRFDATLSLAGATRAPAASAIPVRTGGFGGVEGLSGWLRTQRVEALVDATHPFAVQISRNAAIAAARLEIPLLRIARPGWRAQEGDRWTLVRDAAQAAAALGSAPRRVLLTVGSKSLAPFRDMPAHAYVVRCIDAPDPLLMPPNAELLLARGPFSLHAELDLLAGRRIELLVTKNSGGAATAAKLQAARLRGVPVIMIERPSAGDTVPEMPDAARAMEWLRALHQDPFRKAMVSKAPLHDPATTTQT